MDQVLVFKLFLLHGLLGTEAFSVTGEEGEDVQIKCVHSNAHSNVKYFCAGECTDKDILVTSKQKSKKQGKYTLEDKGNTFFVTISKLTMEDSGTYWCGIERVGIDTYNEVFVKVIEGNDDDGGDSQSISAFGLSSKRLVYIGASLGVVALALAIVLLVFFRYRKRRISSPSGKQLETVYAAPSVQKHAGRDDIATPSTSEGPEPDGRTKSKTGNVYSIASPQPQSPADGLLYSTVSFRGHTDGSTATPAAATVTYSSIRHASTQDSPVYSNV